MIPMRIEKWKFWSQRSINIKRLGGCGSKTRSKSERGEPGECSVLEAKGGE